jgi:hypothetical protein
MDNQLTDDNLLAQSNSSDMIRVRLEGLAPERERENE